MYLFLILESIYGFLFLFFQHFIVVTELRALLERYCFLISLKGNPFPELLLEFNLLCLGLLDGHAFGSSLLVLVHLGLEHLYLLLELNLVGYVLVHLLLLLHVDTGTEKLVRVGLGLLYLLVPLSVAGLQPLLDPIELRDPLLAEQMALGQQVVQALEVEVLAPLAIAELTEPLLLHRLKAVDRVVWAALPAKRLIN